MHRLACSLLLLALIPGAFAAGPPPESLADWARKSQGRYAYGLYIKGKKVGWVVVDLKVVKHDGHDVFQSVSESFMDTLFDGERSTRGDKSTIRYELRGHGAILSAEKTSKEDGGTQVFKLARRGQGMRVTVTGGQRAVTREVKLPRDTLAHQRKYEAWLADAARKKGDTFTQYGLAWERNDIDQEEKHTYKARKTILLAGLKTTVYDLLVEEDGSKMETTVFPDGKPLAASLGALMSLKMEKEADARKLGAKPVDLMDLTSIYVDKDLGLAREVEALKLEVTGLGDFKVPTSHRQKATVDATRKVTTLELRRDFRVKDAVPLSEDDTKRYTRATPRIQSDQKAITEQAAKIVGDETDAVKKVRKLQSWVYLNLKKSYSSNADTAVQVLDNKAGDCTEHSLLFVALCRAQGLPAREVGGLAFVSGTKPLFGWHAWAEVHDGRQWVSVDPTWGQVYVDATHIKMSEGSRDMAWANVAGAMKMKVVSFKKRD